MRARCGLTVDWSFFESCHGKCYCDPEGGALKNAARHHEINVSPSQKSEQLKNSEDFYKWARDRSGLAIPKKTLAQKRGRGIYRRFFYWVPSKGTGAVNRANLPKLECEGTSKLHEFVDIGVAGKVSSRRAACHQCDACWAGNRHECENLEFTGRPTHLLITHKDAPTAGVQRMERAALNRDGVSRAEKAEAGSIVCIETHEDEQAHPWVISEVTKTIHEAPAASTPYNPAKDSIHFEPVKAKEPVLEVKLLDTLAPGSTSPTSTLSSPSSYPHDVCA